MTDETGLDKVELSGFHDIDDAAMDVLKRILITYVKRFKEICDNFENLALRMKKVHAQVHSEKYEIHASVFDNGKLFTSATTHKDLFLATDEALKKIEHELGDK